MGWTRRAPAPPAASKRDRTEHETQPRRQSCHAACGQRTFVVGNDPGARNAGRGRGADPYLADPPTPPARRTFERGGRHRPGRIVEPSRGLEREFPPQAALFTIAGGAWSPAVAATGRTVGGGRGLSEGRAGQ